MGRNKRIYLIEGYPHTCWECPLCGTRPKEDLQAGDKWTHVCVATDRILSGRGIKQPNARNRCGQRWYAGFYCSRHRDAAGRPYYEITPTRAERFDICQTRILFNN